MRCAAMSTCGFGLSAFLERETWSCYTMMHCYLCRVLVIPNVVFIFVREPRDPLWPSLESKPIGYWHAHCVT